MQDDNIIKINASMFTDCYRGKTVRDVPENILNKSQQIKQTYNCFNLFYDPKMIWEKKKFTKKEKAATNKTRSRFHIIIPDFTDDSMNKRQLTGYLNKLTEKNKTVLYEKIKAIITDNNKEDLFSIIWTYIKTSDSHVYFNLIYLFDKEFLDKSVHQLWSSYISNKEWRPLDYILENNLLLLNDDYEMYCNYIKWKKEVNNLNMTWMKLKMDMNLLLNNIYDEMIAYKTSGALVYKYVIDIYLEQLYKILKVFRNADMIRKISSLDINSFESSSKFLIMNILEKK
jgi:hypothetical protein